MATFPVTSQEWRVLRELILRPDTPLDPDVKNMITSQLDDAEDRFAAICHDHEARNRDSHKGSYA
jgi:hypothetical protein